MREKIKSALTDLISALQAAKIYTVKHPKFMDFIDRAYTSLKEVLSERTEIIIGLVGEEIAVEQDIFFDLSEKLRALILYLKERGIERIAIHRDVKREELANFIFFLISPQKEELKGMEESLHLLGIKNIKAGKIKGPLPAEEMPEQVKPEDLSEDSLEKMTQAVGKMLNEETIDYLELRFSLLNLMEYFGGGHQELFNLVSMKRKDLATFLHLLNVSLLSMYFSSKLGYSKEDVLEIGVAGLFHDIGKLSIAKKLIKKKEKLEEEEFAKMKHHSMLGTQILLRYVDSVGILPVVAAFEHHIRYDQKGYPRLAFPHPLHPISQIISICDVYDALSLKRTYKKDFPLLKIYNIMIKEKGSYFDPRLLDDFLKIMGVWPVGSIVSLSDDRVAVVREQNEEDIFCPKVEVIFPEEKKEFIDLVETKEKIEIKNSLNSLKEGKKYLHLI